MSVEIPEIKLSKKVYLIRYYDHVEFRHRDYSRLSPMLRELTGWIVHEDGDYIIVLSEKPETNDLSEIRDLKPSGFVILKTAVHEIIEL